MSKQRLTIPMKIAITVLLAILASWLLGCGAPEPEPCLQIPFQGPVSHTYAQDGDTDLVYLQNDFRKFNQQYFQNRLKNVLISLSDNIPDMATTECMPDGDNCKMKFNLKYVLAPRIADQTMLHEMCHVKMWTREAKEVDVFGVPKDHGKAWRSCMLQLDMVGAFREVIIDNYREEVH